MPPRQALLRVGSSPRERGTHLLPRGETPAKRFIPARAGNTAHHHPEAAHQAVHPRASGEHIFISVNRDLVSGSSPRERGTRRKKDLGLGVVRFIPARAGNTPLDILVNCDTYGSSPRERGTLSLCALGAAPPRFIPARAGNTRRQNRSGQRNRRFIPARAGNTMARKWSRCSVAVHPRASGEH